MNKFFSPAPVFQTAGLTLIRITVGLFLIYHGSEVFDNTKMNEYIAWDIFKNSSSPSLIVYMGKAAELVAGFLLVIGLITRIACLIIIGTFIYIAFFVGHGKIWYDDQYPFLFILLGMVFFFTGPGKWSLNQKLFKEKIITR